MNNRNNMRIWKTAGSALLASLLCVFVGCADDPPHQECAALGSETTACAICMGKNCCSLVTDCVNSTSCMSATSCAGSCSTETCIEKCESSYSPGGTQLLGVFACTAVSCASECQ